MNIGRVHPATTVLGRDGLTFVLTVSLAVQFNSVSQSCPTLRDRIDCSMPGLPVHHQLPELIQIHVHGVSDAIQPSCPLLAPFLLPSVFPSIRVFSNESVLHIRWPKYWSFSFNISPLNEHLGLISFRMDWLDLLAVQGLSESPLTPQFKSINSLVLRLLYGPAFTFIHDYWKNHSLDETDFCWQCLCFLICV